MRSINHWRFGRSRESTSRCVSWSSSSWPRSIIRILWQNDTHQRAGAKCVDFKTDPTAGSVACDGYAMSFQVLDVPEYSNSACRIASSTDEWYESDKTLQFSSHENK